MVTLPGLLLTKQYQLAGKQTLLLLPHAQMASDPRVVKAGVTNEWVDVKVTRTQGFASGKGWSNRNKRQGKQTVTAISYRTL